MYPNSKIKMCLISKKVQQVLLTIGLCCFWSLTNTAQDQSDIKLLEKKIDSVITLIQQQGNKEFVDQDDLKKSFSDEKELIEKKHRQEIEKLQNELKTANSNIGKLQQENTDYQTKIEKDNKQFNLEIEAVLNQIMLGGTAMGSDGLNYFLELAKKQNAANLQKMKVFVSLFNEVMQMQQEFNEMVDFQKVKESAEVLEFKVASYPGLKIDVLNIIFKLNNYCEYEQKLMNAIALSQTQSSEENRKKQLLRREDEFIDYPYLKSEMEKVKASKEHKLILKCNQ